MALGGLLGLIVVGVTATVALLRRPEGPPVPARVVVPPGETAVAAIDWRMMSAGSELEYTTAMRVVSVPGASSTEVPADEHLDILDGAVLAVSPWVQDLD